MCHGWNTGFPLHVDPGDGLVSVFAFNGDVATDAQGKELPGLGSIVKHILKASSVNRDAPSISPFNGVENVSISSQHVRDVSGTVQLLGWVRVPNQSFHFERVYRSDGCCYFFATSAPHSMNVGQFSRSKRESAARQMAVRPER